MPYLRGRQDGANLWWTGNSWTPDSSQAVNVSPKEAERIVRITHANNRFLDADERTEVCTQESK